LATDFNAIEQSRVFESGRIRGSTIKKGNAEEGEHMALRKITALAGMVAVSMMTCSWPASAAPVEGAWAIHDLILEIYQLAGCEFQVPQKCLRLIKVYAINFIP
jgi:hypothetical protein